MKILTKPLPNDQGPTFPNLLSTNHIVRALYTRAQRHPWVVKIVSLHLSLRILKIKEDNGLWLSSAKKQKKLKKKNQGKTNDILRKCSVK